jgi:hypothetical protein
MPECADDAVLPRLTRLERTMRRWRRMGAGVLAALAVTILVGAAVRTDPKTADEVLARHFILVGRTPESARLAHPRTGWWTRPPLLRSAGQGPRRPDALGRWAAEPGAP